MVLIKNLRVENFKSIKKLELDCRRANIFIGKPGTGKSNILETVGLLSHCYYGGSIKEFVRLESMPDLFFEGEIAENVRIEFDQNGLEMKYEKGNFRGNKKGTGEWCFIYDREGRGSQAPAEEFSAFKFYRFRPDLDFSPGPGEFPLPPFGRNLPEILRTHGELRERMEHIFGEFHQEAFVRKLEDAIEFGRRKTGIAIIHPYRLASETIRELIFYLAIVKTCKDSIIAFEEPEARSFPYYTKYLAELIAADENNQYFISTHNPYFLSSMIEKSPKENIAIFLTYYEGFQTKVKLLSQKEMEKVLDLGSDVFFNIEEQFLS